ncbi:PlxyGVORF28-like protein [Hyphantria cunea granulovirus]|uniref:PlxyGVORF28-like protein n=1 Tax=Hyphantria cunea granulovirus TaxID=307448 RepID=A0AAF1D260_9BBAC|nr:PlxyGVORF28-like protein [Hyphantria cunea granulovirus]QBQ01581.1 PlxyGVORF28-like protein [Hyphantria cunea granulovirus]
MVYFVDAHYNDLYKFEWPVLLDETSLELWLNVDCVQKYFPLDMELFELGANFGEITNANEQCPNIKHLKFSTVEKLKHVNFEDPLVKLNYDLMMEQFLTHQLPVQLHENRDFYKLITIFDVPFYSKLLQTLERFKKYWLFRFKIVTMRYEQEKTFVLQYTEARDQFYKERNLAQRDKLEITNSEVFKKNILDNIEPRTGLKCKETDTQTNECSIPQFQKDGSSVFEDRAADNFNDINITNSEFFKEKFSSNIEPSADDQIERSQSERCSDSESKYIKFLKSSLIGTLKKEDLESIDSLIDNILLQFKKINNCNDEKKLHTILSFIRLCQGSVGLLELLLHWS